MEIILDAGKDMINTLSVIASNEDKPLDVVALKMMSLGTRIYHASKKDNQKNDSDIQKTILKIALVNHELLAEILFLMAPYFG